MEVNFLNFTGFVDCHFDDIIKRPTIDKDLATCLLYKTCTGVQCCMTVPRVGLSVEAFVEVSACDHQLRVGIENLKFNRSLHNYRYGDLEKFDLFGFIEIE